MSNMDDCSDDGEETALESLFRTPPESPKEASDDESNEGKESDDPRETTLTRADDDEDIGEFGSGKRLFASGDSDASFARKRRRGNGIDEIYREGIIVKDASGNEQRFTPESLDARIGLQKVTDLVLTTVRGSLTCDSCKLAVDRLWAVHEAKAVKEAFPDAYWTVNEVVAVLKETCGENSDEAEKETEGH